MQGDARPSKPTIRAHEFSCVDAMSPSDVQSTACGVGRHILCGAASPGTTQ